MNRTCMIALCAVVMVGLISCQSVQPPTSNTENMSTASQELAVKQFAPDYDTVANKLVTQIAGVKEGDIVIINGGVRDIELLEDLAVNARKVGAFPLITVSSDRLNKKYYSDVPERYDSASPKLDLKLAEIPDVIFSVDSSEAADVLAGVSAARIAAVAKAGEPVAELLLKRNVRAVNVGNNLTPTVYRAKQLGITQEELAKAYWNAVNADYSKVQAIGEKVKAALSAGKEIHATSPEGTDLRVRIEGRPFLVSDGVISQEDVKKGGPAVAAYLPAGEVYCAPVAGSAEGKVVVAQTFVNGKEVTNLTLTFARGKLTAMTGTGPGYQDLKESYDAGGVGKEVFSFVDFGINPDLQLWPATKLGNWVQSGMFTVGIGNNIWAGGDIKTAYGLTTFLPGCTITLDGKTVVEKGILKF
jgi:aminopeptidase